MVVKWESINKFIHDDLKSLCHPFLLFFDELS